MIPVLVNNTSNNISKRVVKEEEQETISFGTCDGLRSSSSFDSDNDSDSCSGGNDNKGNDNKLSILDGDSDGDGECVDNK